MPNCNSNDLKALPMKFSIADTFIASLSKLTADEQKLVNQATVDAQTNLTNNGSRLHKLTRSRAKNFWSLSVGMDIRIIVHWTQRCIVFCYTAHHDKSYFWAENRM